MAEKFGPWREVSQCRHCEYVIAKESKWTVSFFVPVCPNCGRPNRFWPVTARAVTSRFGRFLRWEFGGEGFRSGCLDMRADAVFVRGEQP